MLTRKPPGVAGIVDNGSGGADAVVGKTGGLDVVDMDRGAAEVGTTKVDDGLGTSAVVDGLGGATIENGGGATAPPQEPNSELHPVPQYSVVDPQ